MRTVETLSWLTLRDQLLKTLLTEDVEAVEELWLCVGLQTDTTGDLLLDLLESSFSGRRFGSHSYAVLQQQETWLKLKERQLQE